MHDLWGLDCLSPTCRHDTTEAYRLRRQLHRGTICLFCGNGGKRVSKINLITGKPDIEWYVCERCTYEWRAGWDTERNDQIFRTFQKEAALDMMGRLGVDTPEVGKPKVVEKHPSLPPGYDARLIWLTLEKMPKSALYFRRRMGAEPLDPTFDCVFQCDFAPGSTMSERRAAPQRALEPDQFKYLISRNDGGMIHTYAPIRCQHCGAEMPLKGFSTLGLREVDLGE